MPFKKGEGRQALNLTENEIRYAQENSYSANGAARFLRVDYDTYKKYAKMYVDSTTGQTLFDMHKNPAGKGLRKKSKAKRFESLQERLQPIIDGTRPDIKISQSQFKTRLIKALFLEEKCDNCGFCERRVFDYTIPLMLDWIDGDKTNHLLSNLRLLCHNCYYLEVGNVYGGGSKNWNVV
jgi:hypothetical protein